MPSEVFFIQHRPPSSYGPRNLWDYSFPTAREDLEETGDVFDGRARIFFAEKLLRPRLPEFDRVFQERLVSEDPSNHLRWDVEISSLRRFGPMVSIGLEGLGARVDRVALLFCHQVAELAFPALITTSERPLRRIPNDHFCFENSQGDAGTDEFQQFLANTHLPGLQKLRMVMHTDRY